MPTLNNFVNVITGPRNQGAWYDRPTTFVADETTTAALQLTINTFLDSLALPLTPEMKYSITGMQYSSAQYANNEIHYSALVNYRIWEPF